MRAKGSGIPWRDQLVGLAGPSFLAGLRAGDWFRLLRENDFAVDLRYVPRAIAITALSVVNSPLSWLEIARYGRQAERTEVAPPLFVLGHWRSGTSLLFDLLSLDERTASPTLYEVLFPSTFLLTEPVLPYLLSPFLPHRRPGDKSRFNLSTWHEDEFATCLMSLRGSYLGSVFPRREQDYERYNTFRETPRQELQQWQCALKTFMKKLTLKHGRQLVMKSPPHTGRIGILLKMFPEAKFVHIHRNPYDVFRSTRWTMERSSAWQRLQEREARCFEERTLRQYKELYDAFFSQRDLVPCGNFHELAFEDLERSPVDEIRKVYDSLSLGEFGAVEPSLRTYVESISAYRKNIFRDLPQELRERIAMHWRRSFEEWGYPL